MKLPFAKFLNNDLLSPFEYSYHSAGCQLVPPPEEFLHSIDFVDQLDLDRNGVGEVSAVQGGIDAHGYLIFKKVAGRWRRVYGVMGDAC